MDFYICEHCKNIITFLNNTGVPVNCCGENMNKLIPNTSDAASEKHIPVVKVDNNTISVCIGETEHTMTEEHYIEWIAIETNKGYQLKKLSPSDPPKCDFIISEDEKIISIYSYCNLHSLWIKSL